ncbi:ABC transporter substrate-binding protein [Bradyrhizobium sp. WSM1743]|uniref:ABC transporter substrate-binding protein n=1 Tax=Bradyrhizobium sp. WSM1743 TaxID=318996 RepID=UPI000487FE59|nr:ABC transporter substrate-binding protein [Bradyrhizobium sp. WSM1743]
MRRREFIAVVGAAAVGWPSATRAQSRILRVGSVSGQPRSERFWQGFEQRMAELGYQDGKNFAFDHVQARTAEAFASGYEQLLANKPDIVIASGTEIALKTALATTRSLPIVMVAVDYDPLAKGYVTSLARPTGNVTGVYLQQIELVVKRLQFVKDAFPNMQAATVFWDQISADQWKAASDASAKLGVRLVGIELRDQPYNYEQALAQAPADHRGNLIVMTSPFFFRDRARLAEFALGHRMASMFSFREWVDVGGLLSYGPSITGMYRRAAEYVDRIARGAKPADLPIEQPTNFEFVVNLKTAKVLGLTISPTLLAGADEVIE